MARRIKIKGGTTQAWSSTDPILSDREIAYEKNTKKIKVGDGVNKWSALDGINADTLDGKNSTDFWSKQEVQRFNAQIPEKILDTNVAPNLNNFVNAGMYAYTTSRVINAPEDALAVLYVQKPHANYVIQTWVTKNGNMYIRALEGSTWSSWRKFWNMNNMGPGSGLNADLLDGKHGSDFWSKQDILSFEGQIPSNVISLNERDLNSVMEEGLYKQIGDINATPARHYPYQEAGTLIVSKAVFNYRTQIYITYNSNKIYIRRLKTDGTSSSNWVQIFTTETQGPGSGLNADLLDGKHGSDFWSKQDILSFDGKLPSKPINITSPTNLNTLLNSNYYFVVGHNLATFGSNFPVERAGMLLVYQRTDSTKTVQFYIPYDIEGAVVDTDTAMYIRTNFDGTWSKWISIYDNNHQIPKYPSNEVRGKDLNTLTKPGFYTLFGGATSLNFPVDLNNSDCSLIVLNRDLQAQGITQMLLAFPNRLFVRTYSVNVGWQQWKEMANTSDTYSKTEADTKYATKADTYTRSQLYTKSEIASIVPGAILSSCWLRGSKEVSYTGSSSVTLPLQGIPTEVIGTASTWEYKPEEGYLLVDSAGTYKIETYKSILYFRGKDSEEWWKQFQFFNTRNFMQGSDLNTVAYKMQAFITNHYPESFGDNTQRYLYSNNDFLIQHASKITLPSHPDYNKWKISIPSYYIHRSPSAPALPQHPITLGVDNEIFISKLS